MPLARPTLQSGLESAFSQGFTNYNAAGQAWADAVQAYASGIVPPSAQVAAAASALSGALATAFQAENAAGPMEAAFAAFVATVGVGMAPAYTATPPAGAIGFAAIFASTKNTHSQAADEIANAIDAWMKTGTATLATPPNTVVPWS